MAKNDARPVSEFAPKHAYPEIVGESWDHTKRLERELIGQEQPAPPAPREATSIEKTAVWINSLRYLDLIKMCSDITGDDAKARELAAQAAVWAEKAVDTYLKETSPHNG